MIIGLTGGIASGKTTCSDFLQTKGIKIADADVEAKAILAPNSKALAQVVKNFGYEVLQEDGTLNRAVLREKIFAQESARRRLNEITHPLIRKNLIARLHEIQQTPYALLSAPLLFENNLQKFCDAVVVVDLPVEQQLERGARRDGQNKSAISQIIKKQITREKRLILANYIIDNGQSLDNTQQQLEILHQHLIYLSSI
ncbi:dephospho-CoA kinase [Rappaport israeli]|uniref:dephospho-CoA kinase n=1 Tax=Rappaport israeli TaxID=1839807 RepID=UPI00093153CC|nr:dephospho-CoA kinase [Rappaport israeli]